MDYGIKEGPEEFELAISGQLIYSDTTAFAKILQQASASAARSFVVQLEALNHIDSSGLRMLLLMHDLCKSLGASLVFAKAGGQVREMLLHSKFDTIVALVE